MLSRVLEPCTMIRVQTWDMRAAVPPGVEQILGCAWPATTGMVASGRASVLCVGPADWWVVGADPEPTALLRALREAFDGSSFRATDLSAALGQIQLDGPHARAVLAKGCGLGLDADAFPWGRCARTRFAGMPVIVWCTRLSTFECFVPVSYQAHLTSWLADAEAEFQ